MKKQWIRWKRKAAALVIGVALLAGTIPVMGAATERNADLDTTADTEMVTEPDTAADTEMVTEPDTTVDTEIDTEPDTAADTETDTEPDTAADTEKSVMLKSAGSLRAEDAGTLEPYIKAIQLYDGDSGAQLTSDSQISLSDEIIVRYYLNDINAETAEAISGNAYTVPVPGYILPNTELDQTVSIDDEDLLGKASYDSTNSKTLFTFDPELAETVKQGDITGIYFEFATSLDASGISRRQEITIPLQGIGNITVTITDNAAKDPAVSAKSGVCDSTAGVISWTVKLAKEIPEYKDGTDSDYTAGYVFKDIPGSDQTFVDGTFKVSIGSEKIYPESESDMGDDAETMAGTFAYDTAAGGLAYTFAAPLSDEVTITYQTRLSELSVIDQSTSQLKDLSQGVQISNTAELYKPDGTTKLGTKTASVEYSGAEWMTKTGIAQDIVNQTVTWELVINTNGYTFDTITLYDQLEDYLVYEAGSADVTVNGDSVTSGLPLNSYTGENGTADSITLNGSYTGAGNGSAEANKFLTFTNVKGTFTIQYKTKLNNVDMTEQNSGTVTKNKAWLDYTWTITGTEPGYWEIGIPSVEKEYTVATGMVEKSGKYDAATGIITWTVTLNKNRQDVSGASITDLVYTQNDAGTGKQEILPADYQGSSAALGNPKVIKVDGADDGVSDYTVTMAVTERNGKPENTEAYSVKIIKSGAENSWGKHSVTYTYQTIATDKNFYENNAKEKFKNTVYFQNGTKELSAAASPEFASRVLDKTFESYDYGTHKITWKVVVDENRYPIESAAFKDELPSYLTYAEGSFKVDGTAVTEGFAAEENASTGGTTLTYAFPADTFKSKDTAQKTITYETGLDVNAANLPGGFSFLTDSAAKDSNDALKIENVAKLTADEVNVEESATASIGNRPMEKTGQVDSGNCRVDYTIKLNQAGADLSKLVNDSGYVVIDTMSASLILDQSSVELYKANVGADGSFSETGSALSGVEVEVNGTVITMTLPLASLGNSPSDPYILKYSAFVNVGGRGDYSLANSASFGGSSVGVGDTDTVSFHSGYSDGTATRIPGKAAVKLTKTQADDETVLVKGATYGLYAKNGRGDWYLMQSAVTDDKGVISFAALDLNTEYQIKEITAPEGYDLDTKTYTVKTGSSSGALTEQAVADYLEGSTPSTGDPDSGNDNPAKPGSSKPGSSKPGSVNQDSGSLSAGGAVLTGNAAADGNTGSDGAQTVPGRKGGIAATADNTPIALLISLMLTSAVVAAAAFARLKKAER